MEYIAIALAVVNLILLIVLVAKPGAGAEIQALHADLAGRVAGSAAETQQQLGDRLAGVLTDSRRELEGKFSGLQERVQGELAAGRKESAELLTGLLTAQQRSLAAFQEVTDKRLEQIRERTDQRLGEIGQQVQVKLDQNIQEGFRHFGEVQKSLQAAEKQLAGLSAVGTSITELNNLLKLPHLRGGFGEATLERLLADFLPAAMFEMQAPIGDGQERVDAAVRFPNQLLPIDSKFPREQVAALFEASDPAQLAEARKLLARVVRGQANRIVKYIRPDEGTTDMALMFLPSETLYFEVLRDGELWASLMNLKVFPVSPNTLAVTLQGIGLAYKSYEMRQNVEATLEQVRKAQLHFEHFRNKFEDVGEGLDKARRAFETAGTHLRNYSSAVVRLTGEPEEEPPQLPAGEVPSSKLQVPGS
jgi:DNA recombination protein RmuC